MTLPLANRLSSSTRRAIVRMAPLPVEMRPASSPAPSLRVIKASASATSSLACAALDAVSCGVIIVTANASIVFANRRACEIIARADAISSADNRLHFLQSPLQAKFSAYLAAHPGANRCQPDRFAMSLPRRGGEPPYAMTAKPLSQDRNSYGVYLYDFDRERIGDELLSRVYDLTAAEVRIAKLLHRGLNVEQAARALAIRESTVRTHLTKILAKCQVRSMAELLQHLALGPSGQ